MHRLSKYGVQYLDRRTGTNEGARLWQCRVRAPTVIVRIIVTQLGYLVLGRRTPAL